MHKLKLQLLVLLLCGMQCSLLHSMLSVENNKQILWDIIIANTLSRGDYNTYRGLATVNKECNKIIEDKYRPDKKCIERVMLQRGTPILPRRTSWNKDFSRCTWVDSKPIKNRKREEKWKLVLVGWVNDDVVMSWTKMNETCAPLFYDNPCSFFNKKGEAFYHVVVFRKESFRVIQVTSNFFSSSNVECFFGFAKNKNDIRPLGKMIDYPSCIKAFLQSTDVSFVIHSRHGDVKLYHINGVTVPYDYNSYHCYYRKAIGYESYGYSSLPSELVKIMDDRYKEQQCKKSSGDEK